MKSEVISFSTQIAHWFFSFFKFQAFSAKNNSNLKDYWAICADFFIMIYYFECAERILDKIENPFQ